MKSELNTRQWTLYNFLKENANKCFTQCEIASIFPNLYPTAGDTPFHDTLARKTMTDDIRVINNSNVIQKIIISTPRGIKIASEDEFDKYINQEFAAVFRRLARVRKKAKKAALDGQIRLTFGKERDTIEAFVADYLKQKGNVM